MVTRRFFMAAAGAGVAANLVGCAAPQTQPGENGFQAALRGVREGAQNIAANIESYAAKPAVPAQAAPGARVEIADVQGPRQLHPAAQDAIVRAARKGGTNFPPNSTFPRAEDTYRTSLTWSQNPVVNSGTTGNAPAVISNRAGAAIRGAGQNSAVGRVFGEAVADQVDRIPAQERQGLQRTGEALHVLNQAAIRLSQNGRIPTPSELDGLALNAVKVAAANGLVPEAPNSSAAANMRQGNVEDIVRNIGYEITNRLPTPPWLR